jgi:hypothetical protein
MTITTTHMRRALDEAAQEARDMRDWALADFLEHLRDHPAAATMLANRLSYRPHATAAAERERAAGG